MSEFRYVSTVAAASPGAEETLVSDLALAVSEGGAMLHAGLRSGAITSWDVTGAGFGSPEYIDAPEAMERANLTNITVLGEGSGTALLTGGVFGHAAAHFALPAMGGPGGAPVIAATSSMGHLDAVLPVAAGALVALSDRGGAAVAQHLWNGTALTELGSLSTQGPVAALALTSAGANGSLLVAEGGDAQSVTRYGLDTGGQPGPATATLATGPAGPAFADPTALATAEVAGTTYGILASAGSSSLSVFSLDAGGGMTLTDHLLDTRESRFAGVSALDIVTRGDEVFVLAGGADDGLSLMALLPGGRLHPLAHVADSPESALANIAALAARETDTGLAVFTGSASEPGVSRLHVELASYGGTRQTSASGDALTGGGADDILLARHGGVVLTGGAGNDSFVFAAPLTTGTLGQITDFDPARDSIDLSSVLALNPFDGVSIEGGGRRAILTMGTVTLDIAATAGATLAAADFARARIASADRPVADPASHPAVVNAVPEPDPYAGSNPLPVPEPLPYTPGTNAPDPVQEPLPEPIPEPFVPAPDDPVAPVVPVAPPAPPPSPPATPTAPTGGQTMTGTAGGDVLSGSDYADTIRGGAGNDDLRGQSGNDTLFGGSGADTIRGGLGNDLIHGDAGEDELRGGEGRDHILGGNGNDQLYGNAGDDVLTGSGQSDTVFGGAGADFVNGGWGYDRLEGGSGADRFFHLGHRDHGSDWVDDYAAEQNDILLYGDEAASAADFHVNFGETAGAGAPGVEEAFVIHSPTGQIIWAVTDGAAQSALFLQIAGQDAVIDLYG